MPHAPALIGMACRFPGAPNLQAYWNLLRNAESAVAPADPMRWPDLASLPSGGYLPDIAAFDPAFFGISQQEAQGMDPQQRWLLQLTWEALEDAGLVPAEWAGRKVGVFIGLSSADYAQTVLQAPEQVNMYTVSGLAASVAANRISYIFDFKGPSLVVDTACSSALVAMHLAQQALAAGDCELALVGAANLLVSPLIQAGFGAAQALSPSGRCQPFAASADGMVRGEGAGMVLLANPDLLQTQQIRQPRIYARLLGSATGQDGQTFGLSAPSPAGQRQVLAAAYAQAGLNPAEVAFIEAHGTGTPLGDPIEARALSQVVGQDREQPCWLGSVKGNLGHLEAAAGIAGLIKAALSLYHSYLPASLYAAEPNPKIAFGQNGLRLAEQGQDLNVAPPKALLAGVSAFGFGGTNAHLILEQADRSLAYWRGESDAEQTLAMPDPDEASSARCLLVSARSRTSLGKQLQQVAQTLPAGLSAQGLDNLTRQLARQLAQRQLHPWRSAIWGADPARFKLALQAPALPERAAAQQPRLAFVFSGMGGSRALTQNARYLLTEPVYAQRFALVDQALQPYLGQSLLALLDRSDAEASLKDAAVLQSLIFAVQLSLAAFWRAQGLPVAAVLGGSMGEIAAVCEAGLLSVDQAAELLVQRVRLMQSQMGQGSVAVVGQAADALEADLVDLPLWLAAENGPQTCLVAGDDQALDNQIEKWQAAGLFVRKIPGANAPSHTPLMQPLETELLALSQRLQAGPAAASESESARLQFWSTVQASLLDSLPADYWWQNVRQPVRLFPTLQAMHASGEWVLLELSIQAVLSPFLQDAPVSRQQRLRFCKGTPPAQTADTPPLTSQAWTQQVLSELISQGVLPACIQDLQAHPAGQTLDLLPYAWDQQNYWLPAVRANEGQGLRGPQLGTPAASASEQPASEQPASDQPAQGQRTATQRRQDLLAQSAAAAHQLLVTELQQALGLALNQDPESLDPAQALKHLGIGSLVGMELYNRMRDQWELQLPLSEILRGPSLDELARLIYAQLQQEQVSVDSESNSSSTSLTHPAPAQSLLQQHWPLSPAQTRFWFYEALQPGLAYHIPVLLSLTGPLDSARLKRAFEALVQRHQVLQMAYFKDEQGQPYQQIQPLALDWQVIQIEPLQPANLTNLTNPTHPINADGPLQVLDQAVRELARQPFDLSKPPFRVALFQLSEQAHGLLIDMHHLIADGYSFRILYQDLKALYQGQTLLPTSAQFSDYIASFESRAYQQRSQEQLKWWLSTLETVPLQLDLPTDWPRPAQLNDSGKRYLFDLAPAQLQALEACSRQQGLSLFSLLMAAFQLVLYRLSGQADFVIGTPVLGREDLRWQSVVGPFLNLLPIRSVSFDGDLSAYLNAVQQRLWDAFDHQQLPFEALIEALNPPRDLAWTPLIQVVLALHAQVPLDDLETVSAEGVQVQQRELDIGVSRFDLALTLHPEAGGLAGAVEYRDSLFSAERIASLIQAWQHVLSQFMTLAEVSQSGLAVAEICLSANPWQAVLSGPEWQPNRQITLLQRLHAVCLQAGQAIALQAEQTEWSYQRLWETSLQLALALKALGASEADPQTDPISPVLAVSLVAGPEMVVWWLAAWQAGWSYLPLDPTQPHERLVAILEQQAVQALVIAEADLTGTRLSSEITEIHIKENPTQARLYGLPVSWSQPHRGSQPQAASELAYLVLTSGSSGQPKGVEIGFAALESLIDWHLSAYPLSPQMRCSQLANPAFDAAAWEIWPALLAGAQLCFGSIIIRQDPQLLWDWLETHQIQQAFIPTPLLASILAEAPPLPPALTYLLTGGAALQHWRPEHWSIPLYNHYGPSENTVVTSAGTVPSLAELAPNAAIPLIAPDLGQPLPGHQLFLLDAAGQPLPPTLVGQIAIAGPGLAQGYRQQADLNAQAFRESPAGRLYLSGDRGRIQDGRLIFAGRHDRQLKHRGVRIEPAEIEALLLQQAEVQAAWVGLIEQTGFTRLIAWVASPDQPESAYAALGQDLRQRLQVRLPAVMVPEAVGVLAHLPLTPRAKIASAVLLQLQQHQQHQPMPQLALAAASPLEQQVAAIWQALLPQALIQRDSHFFEIGGHSLLALELRHRVSQQLGRELPLRQLFETPTLNRLADWLASSASQAPEASWPELIPAPERWGQPFELTPVQQAYWLGRNASIEGGGVAAHAYLELRLPSLDRPRFEAAINRLIQAHAMLRMVIHPDGRQQVLSEVPEWHLPWQDLRDWPETKQQAHLAAARQAWEQAVMPTDRWPLFALEGFALQGPEQEPQQEVRLLLSLDALMADASSLRYLGQQLQQLYLDPEQALPAPRLRFQDWVQYLQQLRQSARFERDRQWWLERLPNLPAAPDLSALAASPSLLVSNSEVPPQFERLSGRLNQTDWQAIQSLASAWGVSPTALLLSGFGALLGAYQARQPMTLNLTSFARLPVHADLDQLVGDFTQLSLIQIQPQPNFQAQTQAVQQEILEVLEHSLFSGLDVMRALRQQDAPSAAFPVVFTSALGHGDLQWPLQAELIYSKTQTPQVWLDHQLMEVDAGLLYHWDYPLERFDPSLIKQLFEDWQTLLGQLSQATPSPLSASESKPIEPIEPELALARQWPQASAALPVDLNNPTALLHAPFLQQAQAQPQKIAIMDAEGQLSYGDLLQQATTWARALEAFLKQAPQQQRLQIELDPEPARVAIYMPPGRRQAIAALACLLAGCSYLPLSLEWPQLRLESILQQAQPLCILSESTQASVLADLDRSVLELDQPVPAWLEAEIGTEAEQSDLTNLLAQSLQQDAQQLAYIIFTSGSSGQPKGVMISHAAAWNTVRVINAELELTARDRLFALSALSFDLSVYDLFGALSVGAALVYPEPAQRQEPAHWLALCQQAEVSIWNSVPALLQLLCAYLDSRQLHLQLPALRALMLSGDWIPLDLPQQARRYLLPTARLYSLGGATEASIWSIIYPIKAVDPDWRSIPYGRALAGQDVYVLDPWLAQTPVGCIGEIVLAGEGVARGYLGDPERSAARFLTHPVTGQRLYLTGDQGRYWPDGSIEFLGRKDQQVKIGGYRIELGEIEAQLRDCPGLQQAVALTIGQREQAFLALCWTGTASQSQLSEWLSARVPSYMLPVAWHPLTKWPLNATGKLDRQALSQQLQAHKTQASLAQDSQPPASRSAAARDWEQALRRLLLAQVELDPADQAALSPETDLLSLGLHSLDMVRLGAALENKWGHAPGMGDLLRLRSLGALADYYLERQQAQTAKTPALGDLTSTALISTGLTQTDLTQIDLANTAGAQAGDASIILPAPVADFAAGSQRQYGQGPLSLEALGHFLAPLRHQPRPAAPPVARLPVSLQGRAAYASASALYPVALYLQLRAGAVSGLEAGPWLYLPESHALQALSQQTQWPYPGVLAQPWTAEASLAVYLLADLSLMRAKYGQDARDYCLLEAGAIAQILRQSAPEQGLGLCALGQNDRQALDPLFLWSSDQELLLSLLGGPLQALAVNDTALDFDAGADSLDDSEQWEEWVL